MTSLSLLSISYYGNRLNYVFVVMEGKLVYLSCVNIYLPYGLLIIARKSSKKLHLAFFTISLYGKRAR